VGLFVEVEFISILVDLAKDFGPSAFAFRQGFIKILTKFQQNTLASGQPPKARHQGLRTDLYTCSKNKPKSEHDTNTKP